LAVVATPLFAQVELGVVQTDAAPIGVDFVIADVFVNVDPADSWSAGGLAGSVLATGLQHYPSEPAVVDLGICFSPPREQFSPERCSGSAVGDVWNAVELNLAWLQFPPTNDEPDFGFVARVTLQNFPDVSGISTDDIVVAPSPAQGVLLAEYTVAAVTTNVPSPTEFTFGFYWIDPCPADLDGDNAVGLGDLGILLSNFGATGDATPEDGDLDGDRDVDLADLGIMLAAFGTTC